MLGVSSSSRRPCRQSVRTKSSLLPSLLLGWDKFCRDVSRYVQNHSPEGRRFSEPDCSYTHRIFTDLRIRVLYLQAVLMRAISKVPAAGQHGLLTGSVDESERNVLACVCLGHSVHREGGSRRRNTQLDQLEHADGVRGLTQGNRAFGDLATTVFTEDFRDLVL